MFSQDIYSDLPPLDDVLEQFYPSTSSRSSKFSLSETTNYLDLGYYISILAIALSNVRGYVIEERRASQTKHSTLHRPLSPHKRTESPKDLQLVYTALETLHSNICQSSVLFTYLSAHILPCSRFQSPSLGAITYKGNSERVVYVSLLSA